MPDYSTTLKCIGICLLMSTFATSCKRDNLRVDVSQLFDGFVFAGELANLESWPVAFAGTPTRLPEKPESGRYYVFYHRSPNDPVEFALHVLPKRLADGGWTVTQSPKSLIEFEQPEPGQARFAIAFEKGGWRGRIFNRYDPNLERDRAAREAWGTETYVLTFAERTPSKQ